MKKSSLLKIIAVFTFIFMGYVAQAQTSFSCGNRTICQLDEYDEIEDCTEQKESSLFVFNEALTMITHTTETNKTVYYINDSEYDDEDNSYTFYVTSENGKNYTFFIFPDDDVIAVYFTDEDYDSWVVLFEIKTVF